MRYEDFRKFVASKRSAANSLMQMSSVSPVLLEILVQESVNIMDREDQGNSFAIGIRLRQKRQGEFGRNLVRGSTLARFEDKFGVSSYNLEYSGYRRTFSRHKDYMLANWMIEILPIDWPDEYKRRGIYYNTTPLGKVLAMKYWYNEFLGKKPLIMKTNEFVVDAKEWSKFSDDKKEGYQIDIRQSYGEGHKILDDGRLGIEIKPDDLLISFFQVLPRLKKFSDDIKKPFTGLGPKEALQFTFSEIDINYAAPNNRAGIEIKFRKYETHVQIIRYFRLDNPDDLGVMHDYILDSITFFFLRNLEVMQKELGVKNPVVSKILEDPDLKSFREDYQMKAKSALQESLSFLSNDN